MPGNVYQGHLCLRAIIMSSLSCAQWSIHLQVRQVFSQQPSVPLRVMWHRRSSAVRGKKKIPLHSPTTSSVLCSIWQGPWEAVIQATHHCVPLWVSFTHICLCVFLPSSRLSSISSPFNCLCVLLSPPLFCSFRVLLCLFFLVLPALLSFYISLMFISVFPLSSLSTRVLSSTRQKCTKPLSQASAQSSLSDSFILSANNLFNSTRLICVYPPTIPMHAPSHNL